MRSDTEFLRPAARRAWERFASALEVLVREVGQILGPHLRQQVGLRHSSEAGSELLEIAFGHTALEIRTTLVCARPEHDEPAIAAAFSSDAPVLRILVFRRSSSGRLALESLIAVDAFSGRWIALPNDVEPARLDDDVAVDRFLCTLLADRDEARDDGPRIVR